MENKTAIIIGHTGLVGSCLLQQLLDNDNYSKIKVFGRRKLNIEHKKLEQHIVDFENLENSKHLITGDDFFSTLGTTRRKAGSKEAQFKVDFDYQFNFAKTAAENKVKNYFLVSAAGASVNAKNFYMRMKGELDMEVQNLPFQKIEIFRPSALVGRRKELRIAESLAVKAGVFIARISPKYRKYRPIHGYLVARGLVNLANRQAIENKSKASIYQFEEIYKVAGISHMLKSITILQ